MEPSELPKAFKLSNVVFSLRGPSKGKARNFYALTCASHGEMHLQVSISLHIEKVNAHFLAHKTILTGSHCGDTCFEKETIKKKYTSAMPLSKWQLMFKTRHQSVK